MSHRLYPANNQRVFRLLQAYADLLEACGENIYRARALRNAARTVASLTRDVAEIDREAGLSKLPGIGRGITAKIREILQSGTLSAYEDLKAGTDPLLVMLLEILPGSTQRVAELYRFFQRFDLGMIEGVVRSHLLRQFPEVDKAVEDRLLEGIRRLERRHLPSVRGNVTLKISGE